MQNKNTLTLVGMVSSIEKSHDFHGERFYKVLVEVVRLSENADLLPVIVSEKLLFNNEVAPGQFVTITGQVRTKNQKEDMHNRLLVFGYANDVCKNSPEEMLASEIKNEVELEGYVCKMPTHRQTMNGRILTDLMVACNRQYSKSDYIPCIAWGVNAKMAKNLRVGDKIAFKGRFQSRNYYKKSDNCDMTSVAYEVSISHLDIVKQDPKPLDENIVELAQAI